VRRALFFLFAFLNAFGLFAQLDTAFYLPPIPEWLDQNQEITLSTPFPDAEVVVFNSDSSYFQTVNLLQGLPVTLALNSQITNLWSTYGAISLTKAHQPMTRTALFVRSNRDIMVTQRVNHVYNQDLVTGKGTRALGTAFLAGNQTKIVAANPAPEPAMGFISVVATEPNTTVVITLPPGVLNTAGANQMTVSLQAWQSYTTTIAETYQFAGASITSTKPIAVTTGGNHYKQNSGAPSQDGGFDQLVPEDLLGTEYMIARGIAPTGLDYLVLLPTADSTEIKVNGVVQGYWNRAAPATITFAGNQSNVGDLAHVEASAPLYCFHISTGSNQFQPELGMSLVPPIGCTGSRAVYATRMSGLNTHLLVIVPTNGVPSLKFNGTPWSGAVKTSTNGLWKSIYIPDNQVTGTWALTCQKQFHVEVIAGEGAGTGLAGFYSGFDSDLDLLDPYLQLGSSILNFPVRCSTPLPGFFGLQTCNRPVEVLRTKVISGQATVTDSNPWDTLLTVQPALGFAGEIWVRLVARDASGSMDSVLMRFPYYPEGADLLPDTVLGCPGSPATVTAPFGMKHYLWSTGDTTQSVQFGGYGPLVLYASSDSCAYTDTVWVASADPLPRVLPRTILVCDSSYVAEIGEFTGVDSLAWRGPDNMRGVAVPSAVGGFSMAWDRPGDYILEKFDANGCLTFERVELKLNPAPLIQFAGTCPDYWVWLQDVSSVSEFRVEGRSQSVDSVMVSFDFDGVYLLEAVIVDLCGQIDTIQAQLPYFCTGRDLRWVPNAFTPNGDGDNDAFCLSTSYGDALRYVIFNRWGGVEFEGLGSECWVPPTGTKGAFTILLIFPEIEGRKSRQAYHQILAIP
jgi:hypothetical protein